MRAPCDFQPAPPAPPSDVTIRWPSTYARSDATAFVAPLARGLERIAEFERSPVLQEFPGLVIFEVAGDRGPGSRVAIDYRDTTDICEACFQQVSVYFKFQCLREGYGRSRIVPGGYVAGKPMLYHNYCRLRQLRAKPPRYDVYGRFGLRFAQDIRQAALNSLSQQGAFGFYGGSGRVIYMQTLLEAARARVCIDLPGNGPFCYRLVDSLAIGACIIGPRHRTTFPTDLLDRVHMVYCRDDLSDLTDLCAYYVRHEDEREAIADHAARYFDQHLHPMQLASYYLATCAAAVRGSASSRSYTPR